MAGKEGLERTLTRLVVMCSRRSCMSLSRSTFWYTTCRGGESVYECEGGCE